jgi:hypothetical protein
MVDISPRGSAAHLENAFQGREVVVDAVLDCVAGELRQDDGGTGQLDLAVEFDDGLGAGGEEALAGVGAARVSARSVAPPCLGLSGLAVSAQGSGANVARDVRDEARCRHRRQ